MGKSPLVYLLHFDRPVGHARHYMGCSNHVVKRLTDHAEGRGARLVQVARNRGISFVVARTWLGGWPLERRLKRMGGLGHLCPVCGHLGLPCRFRTSKRKKLR